MLLTKLVVFVSLFLIVYGQFTLAPDDIIPEKIHAALHRLARINRNVEDVDRLVSQLMHFRSKSRKLQKSYGKDFNQLINDTFDKFGLFGEDKDANVKTLERIKDQINELFNYFFGFAAEHRRYEIEYLVDLYYEMCAIQHGRRYINYFTPHQAYLLILQNKMATSEASITRQIDLFILQNLQPVIKELYDADFGSLTRWITKAFDEIGKIKEDDLKNREPLMYAGDWLLQLTDEMKEKGINGIHNVEVVIKAFGHHGPQNDKKN